MGNRPPGLSAVRRRRTHGSGDAHSSCRCCATGRQPRGGSKCRAGKPHRTRARGLLAETGSECPGLFMLVAATLAPCAILSGGAQLLVGFVSPEERQLWTPLSPPRGP